MGPRRVRGRFWVEAAVAGLSTLAVLLTLAWPEWIEEVFGVDPDGGNGALEWAIVAVALILTLVLALMARTEWRRARAAPEH